MGADESGRRDDKRAAIINIAHEAFLAEGYAATSMSAIAARLGGSKATLYNYFPSKEELFLAVVQDRCGVVASLLEQCMQSASDFRTGLTRFGERFTATVLSETFVATYRIMIAESVRFPEIGRAFYESGPRQGAHLLGAYMTKAIAAGWLTADDPDRMAKAFMDLCLSDIHQRRLLNAGPEPEEDEIAANVARAVRMFLAAYSASAE